MSLWLVTLPWTTRHMPVLRAWRTVRVPAHARTVLTPVARSLYLPLFSLPGKSLASMPWLSSCGSLTWPSCLSLLDPYWGLGVIGKGDLHAYSTRIHILLILSQFAFCCLHLRLILNLLVCFLVHTGNDSCLSMDQYWTATTHCLWTVVTLTTVL